MVKIYYTDASLLNFNDDWEKKVSELRYRKINSISKNERKLLSLGVELLLNYAIKEYFPDVITPISYFYDENGKPFIDEPSIQSLIYFSLSHSGKYSVCAISDSKVGIDIELIRDINLNIAKRFFTKEEYEYIISKPEIKTERFFDIWVLKESYLKTTGYGLSFGLKNFSFSIDDIKNNYILEKEEENNFSFLTFLIEDKYKLAICSEGPLNRNIVNFKKIVF